MADSVIEQAKSGVRWVGIGQVGYRLLSIASSIVLARLLMPDDFGVIALARLVLGFVMLLSAWGIDASIIVEEKRPKQIANVAFWINFGIMLVLGLLVIGISPWVKKFYDTPVLQPILIWMGLGLIFQSFELVPRTILNRDLNYKYLTIINLSIEIFTQLLVILLAIFGCGVWSLVIPQILASPLRAIPYWIKTKWRPSLYIEKADIKQVLSFGKSILGAELIRYLNTNTDYFLIGKLLSKDKLGYYSFAFNLANWPVENIVKVINTVSLPTLAKVQSDLAEMRRLFLRMTEMVSLVTFPIFGVLVGITYELLVVIFGTKWIPAVRPLQVIVIYGIMRSLFSPAGRIFLIQKKTHYMFFINLAQFPFLVVAVWLGIRKAEIIGAAVGVTIVLSIGGLITIIVVSKMLKMKITEFIRTISPGFLCCVIFLICGWFFKHLLFGLGLPMVLILLFYLLFAGSLYALSLRLFYPRLFIDFVRTSISIIGITPRNVFEKLRGNQ
ncbi:MAG TPA: lipopolysaccharide biosynthesis protein [Candidatus Marinimicrobia bacterium]|nr:lipopolysaccharide biosynthesis protein [Candidatus Neomarinimicrobiota bacterium]HPA99357.1 lipopolysaccharide biosynthesis protein [Candidatus Neomarinimicrobiota bacterium]HQO73690.1 lipopolysaccharide biosynthesis protein [Candidatus Neomarinimicrobiota bacterium]HQQ84392.1 lipopolysaccharide biosynthesis protein [Candidatus Neomarinimicrobiota bacterium]